MKSHLLLFVLLSALSFASFSCSQEKKQLATEPKKPNQVVLIFNNPIQNGYYKIPDGGSQLRTENGDEIQFMDDGLIDRRLQLNIGAESDTVIVKSKRAMVEIRLMYKGVDDLKYLFQNGDSVVFNYTGIKPIAKVINRQEDYTVTNFSLVERDSIALDEYTALDIADKPILLYHRARKLSRDEYIPYIQSVDEVALKNTAEELEKEYSLLEALKTQGKISNVQLHYRLQNIYYQLLKLQASPLYKKEKENPKFAILKAATQNFENRFPSISIKRGDSLLINDAYTSFFKYTTSIEFSSKVDHYEYNTGTSAGGVTNYPQAYDSIQASVELTDLERKKLQFTYIEKLFQDAGYFPIETRWEYLDKFKNDYQDSAMVNYLVDKFNIKFSIDDDLELVDKEGKVTSLDALLAANKGKVIYIDFWASWCGPCINEMPSSKKLQAELANENIVYVYLSSDRKDRPWQMAMQRLELTMGEHFRIDNAGYTTKMEELNIPSLPHYMIYNTQGKLVNQNAPRPSQSKVLKAELMKYIETSQ